MINIKTIAVPKTTGTATSTTTGASTTNNNITDSESFFYLDETTQQVVCRYPLEGVPAVIDNLTSTSTTDALSANQGWILKNHIDNLETVINFIQANYVKKPDVIYETDGTTGILGVNNNTLGENWQLTGQNFAPYKYLKCYIKMSDYKTSSNSLSPSMVITLPLDAASRAQKDNTSVSPTVPCPMYVAGASACYCSDQNQILHVLVAVDITKTKFQVVCENRIYGTAQVNVNDNGRYLYKIEGCYA